MMEIHEISEEDRFNDELFKLLKIVYCQIPVSDGDMVKYFKEKTSGISLENIFEQLIEEISTDDAMENLKRMVLLQSILERIGFLKISVDVDGKYDRLKAVSNN